MSTLTTQELQQQYIAYFGRPGDPQGIEYWLNESDITTAKEFALKISAQDEYAKGIGAEPVADQVNALYVNLFGRSADADGLIYWTNQVTKGVLSLGNLAYDLIVAAGNPVEGNESQAALDASALSKKTAAAQLFTDNVKAGGFILDYDNESAFDVARSFVTTVKADSQFTSQQLTTFTQGQVVAMSNASKAASAAGASTASAEGLSVVEQAQLQAAQAQTATAQAQLAVATQAAQDAAAAKAEAAAAAEAAKNAPATYKFTKTTDNLTGEGGADTFTGVIQAGVADGTTIFPGDAADGGEGSDKVTVSIAGANPLVGGNPADYTLAAVSLENIETILVSNFETTTGAGGVATTPSYNVFDAGLWNGVETVGVNASSATGETKFNLMKNFVDVEMRNGSGDLFIDYNGVQKITGLDDTQKVTVSGMTAGDLFIPGVETIEITSEVSKSTLGGLNWTGAGAALANNALETLKISGDQNLTITNTIPWANAVNGKVIDGTVDATGASGKVSLNVAGTASTLSVTGGSGDDTFNFANRLDKNDVVEGGDGTDTLLIDRIAAGLDDETAQVTGVEKFGFNHVVNADSTIDESKLPSSVVTLQVDGSDNQAAGDEATFTLNNVEEGTSINIKKTVADKNGAGAPTDLVLGQGVEVIINEKSDNDSNSVDITLDAISGFNTGVGFGIETLSFANYETATIHSNKNEAGTIKDNELLVLTATSTKTLTIDGAADLRIGDLTTGLLGLSTVDATGLTGKFRLDGHSAGAFLGTTYKLPNSQNTIALDATLNNKDTVTGGSHPTDSLTATINGLTATTGALKITDIETINFSTGGNNTIDLAGITGADTISVTRNQQTFDNYDTSGTTTLEARGVATVAVGDATFKVTAADSSGDADTLYMRQDMAENGNVTNSLTSSGIEILDLEIEDTEATAANTNTWTLTKFDGTTINVKRGADDLPAKTASVDLGLLHTNTVSVDTSDIKGTQGVNATNSKSAFTLNAGGGGTVTASSGEWNDTYTISKTTIAHSITGGAGTDTLTLTADGAWTDPRNLTVENLVIDVVPGQTIDIGQAFVATAGGVKNVTIKGGNSLSIFDNETAGAAAFAALVTEVDASEFGGKVELDFADNLLTDTITISAGALTTDQVRNTYTTADGNFKPKTTGVEKLILTTNVAGGSNEVTATLSNTTGVTAVEAHVAAGDTFIIDKLSGEKITVRDAGAGAIISAKLADDSGAEDTFTFELKAAAAINDNTQLRLTDVETVTLKGLVTDQVSLAGIAMDAASKTLDLKIEGAVAVETNATNEDIASIDASGMTEGGSYNQDPNNNGAGRSRTKSATYTGSVGDDTFIMGHEDDVLDGGSQAANTTGDMLRMSPNMELLIGGIVVDLTKSDDVVTTLNGLGNSTAQSNFESVDLSLMQPGAFGSIITANKNGSTILGLTGNSATSRNIINGGDGDDVITGGNAPDRIKPGLGNNTVNYAGSAHVPANESLELTAANTGTDTLVFSADTDFSGVFSSLAAGGTVGAFTGLDAIDLAAGVDLTMAGDQVVGQTIDFDGTAGGGGNETLIFSAPTAAGVLDYSNLSVDANITAITINGNAGNDTITGTTGADTVIAGNGNDTINATAGIDTITGGGGNDTIVMSTTAAAANNVADFTYANDKVVISNTSGLANGSNPNGLTDVAGLGALRIDDVIVDVVAKTGAGATTVGDRSAVMSSGGYTFISDNGQLWYAADGDFSSANVLVATLTIAGGGAPAVGNFQFGIA